MRPRAIQVRLAAVLLSGLALGALGLLEPLIGFWEHFHLLGAPWPTLLLFYLGSGLAIAIAAGSAVSIALAFRSAQWMPVAIAAYYATATAALAAAIFLTPVVHRELVSFNVPVSKLIIFPVLLVLGAAFTYKGTRRIVMPLFTALFGYPSGRIALLRLTMWLLLIGLLIPVTIAKDLRSRYRGSGRPPRPALATRPSHDPVQNVLLITIDDLRADHLGSHGYARPTSPRIDALAREGYDFTRCFAQANCTELSFGSIFTSLYPSTHAVRRTGGVASRLPARIETLAERMRDAGLSTHALMTNPFLKREWGLTQGFDTVCEYHFGYLDLMPVRLLRQFGLALSPERIGYLQIPRASVVVDDAIARIEEERHTPFFLHVHLMDTHPPYIPPATYEERYRTASAARVPARRLWRNTWPVIEMLPSERELLPPSERQRMIDLYDAAIRYVDDQVGRLLDALDAAGLAERTLVLLTSDHGDEFLEHGDIFHKSPFLYDELIHVPLIVRVPERQGERVTELVRHIDLAPTLLELFGQPPIEAAQGTSLLPLLGGDRAAWTAQAAYSQSYEFIAVRTPERKLMYDLARDRTFCFDLRTDPRELHNVYGTDAGCDSLDEALMEFLKRVSVPADTRPKIPIDSQTREVLGTLGYIDL